MSDVQDLIRTARATIKRIEPSKHITHVADIEGAVALLICFIRELDSARRRIAELESVLEWYARADMLDANDDKGARARAVLEKGKR